MSDKQEALEQFTREQQTRDEGIRRAFVLLRDAMLRMQTALDEIHQAATREHPPSQVPVLLAEIKTMLEAQPGQTCRRHRLDARRTACLMVLTYRSGAAGSTGAGASMAAYLP